MRNEFQEAGLLLPRLSGDQLRSIAALLSGFDPKLFLKLADLDRGTSTWSVIRAHTEALAENARRDGEARCDGVRFSELGPDGRYVAGKCGVTSSHPAHWLDGRDYVAHDDIADLE